MAYLSTYDYNIFISYAHKDNEIIYANNEGWVDQFEKRLKISLDKESKKSSPSVKIWRDNQLDGNQLFDQSISETIKKSAIFLALISNSYLNSEYCKKELNQFSSYFKNHLVVGDRSRMFGLLLSNISPDNFPDGIDGTICFPFYDAKSNNPSEPDEKMFRAQLSKLVAAIFRILEQKEKEISVKATTDNESDIKYPVFFADVSDALRMSKERVMRDLQAEGISVNDKNVPPPYDINNHDKECMRLLSSAKLSVHLFDEYAGREIQRNETYAMRQLQTSFDKTLSQLIWFPKNLHIDKIEDRNHQNFLKELIQKNDKNDNNIELIRGTRDEIFSGIVKKIEAMKQLKNKRTFDQQAAVLLDIQEKDNIFAYELVNYLSLRNIKFLINPAFGKPKDDLHRLAENLKLVNSLMLVCGNVNNENIIFRTMTLMNMIIDLKATIKTRAIFLAPPKRPDEVQDLKRMIPQNINMQLLNNIDHNKPRPEVINPFVECIGSGGKS